MPQESPGSHERGQILVVFVGAVVMLLLVAGLVVDGGFAFVNRRDSQNEADVTALAGTKRLADYYVKSQAFVPGADNVYTAVASRMTDNGCTAATKCTWTARYVGPRSGATFTDLGPVLSTDAAPPGATSGTKALGVKVNVTRNPNTYFLGVIGQSSWNINTTATAVAGQAPGAPEGQLLPIGLKQGSPMNPQSIYPLTNGKDAPGNFGWISWDGSNSAGALADSLCTPDNPAFTLPWSFPGDPGKTNASAVRACLQKWVDNQETVLIPIFSTVSGNGNNTTFQIVAIAAFKIISFSQPAVDQINGMFEGSIPYSVNGNSDVPGGVTQPPLANSQFYYIGLAQ